MSQPKILAVHAAKGHHFSKAAQLSVCLLPGLGVAGDAHAGATVKHRSRVAKDSTQPNLRQVHLLHVELFAELAGKGFAITPGALGENITTQGLDLLDLPTGTRLTLGAQAVIEITGLRNPCVQLDRHAPGLMAATLDRDADGALVRKAGIMAVVLQGGEVFPGDPIGVALPAGPHHALKPV